MVLDPSTMNGLRLQDFFSNPNKPINPFIKFQDPNLFPNQNLHLVQSSSPASSSSPSSSTSHEDSEIFSDIVLNYISRMLMEEDVDEKVNLLYHGKSPAIEAVEKPFYDIVGEKYPPSDENQNDNHSPNSSSSSHATVVEDPAMQFKKGVEEARKFLPNIDRLVIDLEGDGFSSGHEKVKGERRFVDVKVENEERDRSRKNPSREDIDLVEGRNNKQTAVSASTDETIRSEMFDKVLLCQKDQKSANGIDALREAMQNKVGKNLHGGNAKKKSKKHGKKEVVDLRTLLIHCAQAVATNDRRSANELLRQIRRYSSPFGDGSQRLAHCFADGLEARLAGTGSQIYHSLVGKRTTATDMLKAYHLYLAACPFKRISHFFSNQTILNAAEDASRVHIIDFGIYYGFQWPCLIQRLASRRGGPPMLRITGIDVPQPGFRPTERIEETGKRLADYARSFNVPFQYNAITSKWETIKVEDLNIDKDEVLVINCLYRFRNVVDETVVVDSPRDTVLDTIRKANPHVFIHGIVNGSYSAPFFITRFREALFHFSALFDMLDTNVPREDAQRLLIERDLFGREAMNVISCEGSNRVERPETYKQWQVRTVRAGFMKLPLDPEIMKKAADRAKGYHKDFIVDEDNQWLLQGWKGRIIYALSSWKPNRS